VIYSYEGKDLKRLAAYRTSTAPIDLAVVDDTIAIADLMKSVSLVRYTPGKAGEADRLIEIARHYQIAWSTAVAPIDDNTFLEADAEGNLMVLHQNVNGVTADDRRRLEVTSEIQLGEMVNRIRRVNVHATDDTPVIPRALMATVRETRELHLQGLTFFRSTDLCTCSP
jgi:DNA damage-binding protein 1